MKRDRNKARQQKREPQRIHWGRYAVHAPLLLVILSALAAYSNSFHAPFLLDNDDAILQDTRVHAATGENVSRILGSPYHQTILTNLYRPVATLSYLFNYSILGGATDPSGYHTFNFVVHALNIALVYLLALALFEDRTAALAAAALWGLHPILTEGVTNIVGRADMLASFGVLAGVLCYRAAAEAAGRRRIAWIAGVAAASAVAACSKENGMAVVAVLLLFDIAFLREFPFRTRAVAFAAAVVPVAIYIASRVRILAHFPYGPIPFVDNPIVGGTFWAGRITAFHVIARYFGLFLWPARLSADYSYNEIPVAADPTGYLGLALCLVLGAAALWAWRRHKPLFFAILFFFVTLAPVSNVFLVIGSIMGERFLYLPSVGLVLAIVYGLHRLVQRLPQTRYAVAAAVCLVLIASVARTWTRNDDWNDDRRLWTSVVEAAPGSYKGHINLATKLPLEKRADRDLAVAEIGKAIAILDRLPDDKNAPAPYRMAGAIYRNMGDEVALGKAEPDGTTANDWYQKAMPVLFKSEVLEVNRDNLYRAMNQRRGTPRATFLPSAIYFELGRTWLRQGKQLQALSYYERGRALEPNADLLEDEGGTFDSYHEYRRAAQAYIEALEVDGRRTDLTAKIVEAYRKLDPNGCAVKNGALDVKCPMVHSDICGAARNVEDIFMRRGQPEDAAAVRRVSIIDLGCTSAPPQGQPVQ